MHARLELLVIGPRRLSEAVSTAVPGCAVALHSQPTDAVWDAGRRQFHAAIVSAQLGSALPRVVRALRRVAPAIRILVTCEPGDEPAARAAVQQGADDYVIEPLQRDDLREMFGMAASRQPSQKSRSRTTGAGGRIGAAPDEYRRLAEILAHADEGVQATMERLADLIRHALDCAGVRIELGDSAAEVGDCTELVMEQALRPDAEHTGRIALGPRRSGAFDAVTVERLRTLASLVEAKIKLLGDRARLEELAWHDDLSGLHNRRYFEKRLRELLAEAVRQRSRVTVLLFDIDDFKSYNDAHGHAVGDAVIRELATLLTQCTRQQDVVARYGGDEFAVIFWDAEGPRQPDSEHPKDAMELATRLLSTIETHDFACLGKNAPGEVTISGGLACYPWNGATVEELLEAADRALLAAKRDGKRSIRLGWEAADAPSSARGRRGAAGGSKRRKRDGR